MSVNIETSVDSMSKSLDPLKTTISVMHRMVFELDTLEAWYAIMREARAQFGSNWRAQPRVKRKMERMRWNAINAPKARVWFEVPDATFATFCAVKLGVDVCLSAPAADSDAQ